MEASPKWPNYFPEGCPPEEATPRDIFVYRCAETKPHSEKDFIPYYLRYDRDWGKNLFMACGLSCYTDLQDVIKLKKKLPKFKCIICGTILKETGVVLETPSKTTGASHVTWWVYEGIEAHKLFSVYEEGNTNE